MNDRSDLDPAGVFDPLRPKLTRVAYRLLGSIADAEDTVQEAFLRWLDIDRSTVREPEAYLRRIVTRLSINTLRSAQRRREVYVGTWLPEPVIETPEDEVDDFALPLMLALERLSPLERAAFILHDIFDIGFDEIATTIGRDAAACRQLAKRARDHVRIARPRFPLAPEAGSEIAAAFFQASRTGDLDRLRSFLARDVILYSDGGGKVRANTRPIAGVERVLRLYGGLAKIYAANMSRILRFGVINGLPGFVTLERHDVVQATALQIEGDKIVAIYAMRNPEKLRHLDLPAVQ
jgi:RNA polymerase sigma-70 factor (ECF subfamily)